MYAKPGFKFLAASVLVTATLASPLAMAQTTKLTMSSWVPPAHFIVKDILLPWTEAVKQATNGRVSIELLPKAVGSPPQHFELARKGVADVTWGNFTYEPERFKMMWFAELPMMGTSDEAASVALWRTYDKYLASNAAFKGVKMVGVGMLGGGQIHHPSKGLVNPEDFKGLKVRMGGPIQKRLLEELGAVPVSGPATKAYEMLQGGVIDASLHPIESVVNFRLDGILKHHTIVPKGFYDGTFFIVMNEGKFKKLSAADQQAVMKVSGEMLSRNWGKAFDQQSKAAQAKMSADGHVFVQPSSTLVNMMRKTRSDMLQELNAEGAKFGVPDHNAVVSFYEDTYQSLMK